MRLNDEYKFKLDDCNLNITLEPYTTKYEDCRDDLKLHHISSDFYSRRLTFLDEYDTIYREYWKEELTQIDHIKESMKSLIEDPIADSLVLSCNVVIEIFENTTKINTIKILEEPS